MNTERILYGGGRDRLWHCSPPPPPLDAMAQSNSKNEKKNLHVPPECMHRGRKSQLPPPTLRGFKVKQLYKRNEIMTHLKHTLDFNVRE